MLQLDFPIMATVVGIWTRVTYGFLLQLASISGGFILTNTFLAHYLNLDIL